MQITVFKKISGAKIKISAGCDIKRDRDRDKHAWSRW